MTVITKAAVAALLYNSLLISNQHFPPLMCQVGISNSATSNLLLVVTMLCAISAPNKVHHLVNTLQFHSWYIHTEKLQ